MDIKKLLEEANESLQDAIDKENYFKKEALEHFVKIYEMLGSDMEQHNNEERELIELYPGKGGALLDLVFRPVEESAVLFRSALRACEIAPQSLSLHFLLKLKASLMSFLIGVMKFEEDIKKETFSAKEKSERAN